MKKLISVIIMMLSGMVLLGCGLFYYKCYQDCKKSVGAMKELEAAYVKKPIPEEEQKRKNTAAKIKYPKSGNSVGDNMPGEKPDFEVLLIDWPGLISQNKDIAAWIDIPGTVISYPVVQATDDEYYLHHTITREANDYGAIFLSSMNKKDFSDSHSIIYGHNMSDGTMFAEINKYNVKSMYENAPYIHIYTPENIAVYKVFSCFQSEIGGLAFILDLDLGSHSYYEQVRQIKAASDYDTGTKISARMPFITLMTCNSWGNPDARTALHAVRQKQFKYE